MTKAKRLSLSVIVTGLILAVALFCSAFSNAPANAVAEDTAPAFTLTTQYMERTEGVDLTASVYSDYVFYGEYWGKAVYRKPGVENSGIVETRAFDVQNKFYDNLPFNSHETGVHRSGTYSDKQGDQWNHEVTVSGKGKIIMFTNGYDGGRVGECHVTVTDKDGNVQSAVIGTQYNWYNRVEIAYDEETTDTYSIVFEKIHGNGSIAAIAIQPDDVAGEGYGFNVETESLTDLTDLSSIGNQDYMHFNCANWHANMKVYRKNLPDADRYISDFTSDDGAGYTQFYDYKSMLYYTDATSPDGLPGGVSTWGGSNNSDGTSKFTVKADENTDYIKLYTVTWRDSLELTVKDGDEVLYQGWPIWQNNQDGVSGTGNVTTLKVDIPEGMTKTFTIYYKRGVKPFGGTNAGITAIAVGSYNDEATKVHIAKSDLVDYNGGDNLTTVGTKDWFHFGSNGGQIGVNTGKNGGTYFGELSGTDLIGDAGVTEYKTLSWTDGDTTATATDTKSMAVTKNGTTATLKLKAHEAVNLKLYLGAIKCKAVLRVTDAMGNLLDETTFVVGDGAAFKTINYALYSGVDQTVSIVLITTERNGQGSVYMVGGALSDGSVNHTWDEGVITQETTCHTEGNTFHTCTVCGSTKNEPIAKIDHVFDKKVTTDAYLDSVANCSKPATYFYSCYCGERGTETFGVGTVDGTHEFIEEIKPQYLKAAANCQHVDIYYKSCSRCGVKGTETFEDGDLGDCEYAVKVVSSATAAEAATCTSAAKYYYTCECGLVSDSKTFAYGKPIAHSYVIENATEATLASGLLCSKDATFYYTCECGAVGEETFGVEEAIGEHVYDKKVIADKYKVSDATCTATAVYYYTCACGDVSDDTFNYGKYAMHNYVTKVTDEAHLVSKATCKSPAVYYYTCDKCDATGNANAVYTSGNAAAHNYNKAIISDKYLKSAATCTAKAVYFYSCGDCGVAGDMTFEAGNKLAHSYVIESATEANLATEATCTAKATYYKSCVCGKKGSATFEYGDKAAHAYDQQKAEAAYLASSATCTKAATYYKSCVCGKKGTETFTYGEPTGHVYNEQVAREEYVATPATCTAKATYYYTCVCGAKGTETFERGNVLAHKYVVANATEATLATPATCTAKATYYYTCACGAKGTETFSYGEVKAHSYDDGVVTSNPTTEKEGVKTFTCGDCGATKTEPVAKLESDGTEEDDAKSCATVAPVNSNPTGGMALMLLTLAGIAAVLFTAKRKARR